MNLQELEQRAKELVAQQFHKEYDAPVKELMLYDTVWSMKEYAQMYGKKSKVSIFNKDCSSCGAPLRGKECEYCGR